MGPPLFVFAQVRVQNDKCLFSCFFTWRAASTCKPLPGCVSSQPSGIHTSEDPIGILDELPINDESEARGEFLM